MTILENPPADPIYGARGDGVTDDTAAIQAAGRVPIEWDRKTLSWNATCKACKTLVFMVTQEAVVRGPSRPSGSSCLLPVTMTVRHKCGEPIG